MVIPASNIVQGCLELRAVRDRLCRQSLLHGPDKPFDASVLPGTTGLNAAQYRGQQLSHLSKHRWRTETTVMRYELEATLKEDNAKVIEALRAVGIEVSSVYDLVNTKRAYPKAIPVLIEMLPLVKSDRIREGIARALTIKEAGPIAAGPLIKAFRSAPDKTDSQRHAKWAIANALSVVANEAVFKDIFELATQKRHGWTRSMLISVLPKIKKDQDKVKAELLNLLDDEDPAVLREAVTAVGKLKLFDAVPKLEMLLTHESSTIRAGVRRVLKTLRPLLEHG